MALAPARLAASETTPAPVTERERGSRIPVLLILSVAAALRFGAVGYSGSFLTYQADERFYNVSLPFSLDWTHLDPHRFYYPALFWYALFFLDRFTFRIGRELGLIHVKSLHHLFETGPIPYFLMGRSLSALLGTATVALVYRLGRRLYSHAVGLLAALFLAVAFLHVRDSALATVDAPSTFFVVLSLLGSAGVLEGAGARSYTLAAIGGGLAAATKYNAALVLVSLPVAHGLQLREKRAAASVGLATLVRAALVAALVFLAVNPYLMLDWPSARADLLWEIEYQGTGQFLDLGPGWPYHLTVSLRYGLGIPLLGLALLGIVTTIARRDSAGLVLLAFSATFFLVMGHSRAVFVRYMVPLAPVLCLFAASAVFAIAEYAAPLQARRTAFAFSALVAIVPTLHASLAYGRIVRHADTRIKAYEFVQSTLPAGTPVASYGQPIIWNSTFPSLEVFHWEKLDGESWAQSLTRLKELHVRYFLTHHSSLDVFSPDMPDLEAVLRRSATPIAEFDFADPSGGLRPQPVYDVVDGFYLPIGGFRGVKRPGPLIRLYRLD
jgi:4-amino-4-deoxy-L-arabinose transferase-like glycosyltransferase